MLEDIGPRRPRCTSTSSASGRASIGDEFAETLIAKAAEGVPVRLVVDRNGSDPERATRAFYDRLVAAGVEVCSTRATRARAAVAPLGTEGAPALEPERAGPHRPPQGRRGRRPDRLDRRRGDRGPLQRRPLPRPVPAGHRPGRLAAPARLRRELPLAGRSDSGRGFDGLFPSLEGGAIPARCCTTRPESTGRSPMRSRACSRARPRRSTSSTPTSPTAG